MKKDKGGDKNKKSDHKGEKGDSGKKKREIHIPDVNIDTKGKIMVLKKGGHIVWKPLQWKDMKVGEIHVKIYLDGEQKLKTDFHKGEKFDEPAMNIPTEENTNIVKFVVEEKELIGTKYKGEIRVPIETILDGYPHDEWYTLRNKEGKDDKKIKGAILMQLLYLEPGKETKHEEFKYPLHSLISLNRLDLFQRKIDDLQGAVSEKNDKNLTPLVLAAAEGKAGFVKLLVEAGARLDECDPSGRTPIHLASMGGHSTALCYLLKQKDAKINEEDKTDLNLTPLHLAAEKNQPETCKILIDAGATIDPKNSKGDTPLNYALSIQDGTPRSTKVLVEEGADLYIKNLNGLTPWETSQRKDICYSSLTRQAFMEATDVEDAREYTIMKEFPKKTRLHGKNLSEDWSTATQFIIKSSQAGRVKILLYSKTKTDDSPKQVGFCVVKTSDTNYVIPSFQPEGIGFGGLEAFLFPLEEDFTYIICSYCIEKTIEGDFGLVVFQSADTPITIQEAKSWKNKATSSSAWKGKSAAGSAKPEVNPSFSLKLKAKGEEAEAIIMLSQVTKDVSSMVFEGHKIMPAKFYIGLFVFKGKKEIIKSDKWHNSKDVYLRVKLAPGEEYTIVPTTRMEKEESDFTLSVFSNAQISLSS